MLSEYLKNYILHKFESNITKIFERAMLKKTYLPNIKCLDLLRSTMIREKADKSLQFLYQLLL
ncbi:hypothetical protein ADS77_02345 [Pseudoalteromonas porphyrae]|uniref:Uncharacterized protein n=1 Tax=Pseudoalteromonas porphyrae TaxID=187330 RepID=A0A0N1MWI0_9GAMM|nr:hypothetical protein ADS77_02345 [Pseudoalteromonas porphyrae]